MLTRQLNQWNTIILPNAPENLIEKSFLSCLPDLRAYGAKVLLEFFVYAHIKLSH